MFLVVVWCLTLKLQKGGKFFGHSYNPVLSHYVTNWQKKTGQGKKNNVSNEKKTVGLGYIGDDKLPSYMGMFINYQKDPY